MSQWLTLRGYTAQAAMSGEGLLMHALGTMRSPGSTMAGKSSDTLKKVVTVKGTE